MFTLIKIYVALKALDQLATIAVCLQTVLTQRRLFTQAALEVYPEHPDQNPVASMEMKGAEASPFETMANDIKSAQSSERLAAQPKRARRSGRASPRSADRAK